MTNSRRGSPKRIAAAERKAEALKLRKSGATYDEIAKQLGLSGRTSAFQCVQRAIRDITKEPAKDVLELEVARLDAMLAGLWDKATDGDDKAVNSAIRIMDRRAKYLGLDQTSEPDAMTVPPPGERASKLDSMLREYLEKRGATQTEDEDGTDSD